MAHLFLLVSVLVLLPFTAVADDFYDILNRLSIQRPDVLTQALDTRLYAASLQMRLRDGDGNNNNFGGGDLMERLVISSRGGTLSWPIGDRAAVEQFARDHADEIIRILFPGDIAANTIGQPQSQLYASFIFNEVIAPLQRPRSTRRKKGEVALRNELSGRLEVSDIEINNNDGYSLGMLASYKRDFTDNLEAGILIPYRFTDLSDNINTKSHFVQFNLFGKYTVYDNEVTVRVGADALGSALVVTSDAVDAFGHLGYGGGVFSSVEKDFDIVIVTFGVGFKLSKITIPSGLAPKDLDYLANAITDRAIDRDLVYGLNVGVPYKDNFIVNLNIHRTNSFSPDVSDDRDAQTKILLAAQYAVTKTFELNVGYSTVVEVKDYTPHTFFLGAIKRF